MQTFRELLLIVDSRPSARAVSDFANATMRVLGGKPYFAYVGDPSASVLSAEDLNVSGAHGSQWILVPTSGALLDEARASDLVIVQDSTLEILDISLASFINSVGRPVIVIPDTWSVSGLTAPFNRILIAFDNSGPAARAVHDAMPMLRRATAVHMLSGSGPDGKDALDKAVARINKHLLAHDVIVESIFSGGHNKAVVDRIADLAKSGRYDLLVMGAYGHTRLHEAIFGGTSADAIGQMAIPTLVSH